MSYMTGGTMKGATVLSRDQFETIRSRVLDQPDANRAELLRLKALSDERANKWPNTLQAGRARKERARVERAAAEENERVEADAVEAAMQAEMRRIQIERANKILFDESDKVKVLHSKMMESDSIKENEKLVMYKRQMDVLRKAQDAAFMEQQRQAMEAADTVQLKKYEEARQRALEQRDAQNKQLEELKAKLLAEQAANKKEGAMIRKRAEQEALDLKLKEQRRLANAKEHNAQTAAANQALKDFEVQQKERQRLQDIAIEEYTAKKLWEQAEQAKILAAKRAEADAKKKKMADAMQENYMNWHNKEEALLERDVQAEEAKQIAKLEEQRQRRLQQTKAAAETNRLQLQKRAEEKARSLADDAIFAKAWQERVKELKEEERAEVAEKLAEAKKLMEYQKRQVMMKAKRKAAAKMEELHDAAQIQLSLQDQDEIFRNYANECISEYESRGQTTVPLKMTLQVKNKLPTFIP